MRQAYRILPVYTGDVSGVCSALYELGGMVVMHDPSGCNSTYNTHDEIRWYDRDSLIFLSGLCEPDAIMGNDEKLIRDVIRAAAEFKPVFIALCNSPIPYLTGTDFPGICRIIEHRTGIPAFYIPTNGMHDYINGAGMAFEKLAEKLFGPLQERDETGKADKNGGHALNILGMTPLDYAAEGSCRSLRRILEESGWKVRSVWAMEDTLENLRLAGEAGVNLVVSASGLRVAEYLRKRFGTPWVAGTPVGSMKKRVHETLSKALETGTCLKAFGDYGDSGAAPEEKPEAIVIGEAVMAQSIAQDCRDRGLSAVVIAATEDSELLTDPLDRICRGEEETEEALGDLCGNNTLVIADPLYKYVLPEGAVLRKTPHLAFSGRIFRSSFKDPFAVRENLRPVRDQEGGRHGT